MLQVKPECRTVTDKAAMKKAITSRNVAFYTKPTYYVSTIYRFPMELPYTTKTGSVCSEYFLAILWSRLHNVHDIVKKTYVIELFMHVKHYEILNEVVR